MCSFSSCTPHGSSSTSSALTCMQVLRFTTGESHAGLSIFATRKYTTVKEQQADVWYVTVLPVSFEATADSSHSLQQSKIGWFLASWYPRFCCCIETRPQSSAGPDISLLRPELQRQWHHAKNQHLVDKHIQGGCGLRVSWRCYQCPCGLLHEWMATVDDRQHMNHQCPFCTNKRLCQHNSLLTVAPAVAAYWDTAQNGLTPDQVTERSHARRHWLCPSCSHSWQTEIYVKVDNKSGCPKCSNQLKGYSRQPSLTQSKHPAMMGFDFERNRKAGLDPGNITAGSAKVVHWICAKCPKGQPHLFLAAPKFHIGRGHGCPYCSSRKACICNSLQSLYPALAAEYDTARNGISPDQVLSRSATSSL